MLPIFSIQIPIHIINKMTYIVTCWSSGFWLSPWKYVLNLQLHPWNNTFSSLCLLYRKGGRDGGTRCPSPPPPFIEQETLNGTQLFSTEEIAPLLQTLYHSVALEAPNLVTFYNTPETVHLETSPVPTTVHKLASVLCWTNSAGGSTTTACFQIGSVRVRHIYS